MGMHRSGTSLIARCLDEAGIYGGSSTEMLESQPDNPLGFYERIDLVQANDALLEDAGFSWFAPPLTPLLADHDTQKKQVEMVVDALSTRGAWARRSNDKDEEKGLVDYTTFLKDPRLCLTWPVWQHHLADREVIILFVYRNPVAVAQSLHTRHGFPRSFGLLLWEHYNRLALGSF